MTQNEIKEKIKDFDPMIKEVTKYFLKKGVESSSKVCDKLGIGYPRFSRIIDQMEDVKFITPYVEFQERKMLIDEVKYKEIFGESIDD